MNETPHQKELLRLVHDLPAPFYALCCKVIYDERFATHSAACGKHHAWPGGLAQHTLEVVQGVLEAIEWDGELRPDIALTAAVWHDFGKIWDIGGEIEPKPGQSGQRFERLPHYGLIHHVGRSYAEWMIATTSCHWLESDDRMLVGHAILAHHGKPEWGSAVVPQTKEAKALHEADMASAHGNTAGRG